MSEGERAPGAISWTEAALSGGVPPLEDGHVLRAVASACGGAGAAPLTVDVVFVAADELSEMHGEYLGDPSATDVITFDLRDGDGDDFPGPDGELYISLDRARSEAELRGVSLERELTLYVVHGVLHLCGLDDRDDIDRAAMREAEGRVLAALGFEPDAGPHEARSSDNGRS